MPCYAGENDMLLLYLKQCVSLFMLAMQVLLCLERCIYQCANSCLGRGDGPEVSFLGSEKFYLGPESFPACTFFPQWISAGAHQFHSLGQNQSTVAQRADTTVDERSLSSRV